MTQEEKQLLLVDLCARLPYVTYYDLSYYGHKTRAIIQEFIAGKESLKSLVKVNTIVGPIPFENIKPYLRPMSSMTKEELKELNEKYGNIAYFFIQEPPYYHGLQAQHYDIGSIAISEFSEIYNWLNAHHFDYRGLIENGLALEALEEMYKTE